MKTKFTTTYIAFDGKEFDNAEECKAYETNFADLASHIRVYDEEFNELTAEMVERNIDVIYLDVCDDKGVEIWNNICKSDEEISRVGMYYYDFEEEKFIEINNKINELVEMIRRMRDCR